MSETHYLYMAKSRNIDDNHRSEAVSTGIWGIVITSLPTLLPNEVKEAANNNWPDEPGEDTYDSEEAYFKAYDVTIGMAVTGTKEYCRNGYKSMLEYMTTGGIKMLIYAPWIEDGCSGVIFKKVDDATLSKTGEVDEEGQGLFVMEWKVALRVTEIGARVGMYNQNGKTYITTA